MGDGGASDSVRRSVSAYTTGATAYASTHAPKMAEQAARFAASLPVPSLILDAGCGPGRDLARFAAAGHVPRGLELNPTFVEMANQVAPTAHADLRSVGSLYPPDTFDGIWAAASLVHLDRDDTEQVLAHLAVLLRPGGKLFTSVRSTGDTGWLDEPDGTRFYTVWTSDEIATAVTRAGLTIEQVTPGLYTEVWATLAETLTPARSI